MADFYFPNSRIEPAALAKIKSISCSHGTYFDSFDALLLFNEGKFHIELNLNRLSFLNSPRARFSLGHELGHYFIDEHRNSLVSGSSLYHVSRSEYESDLLVEVEADLFSSNLLMPKTRFNKMAMKGSMGFEGITKLSEYFGTSLTSTAIKFIEAEKRPSIIMKWDGNGDLSWKRYSETFYNANLGKSFLRGENFNRRVRSSATDKAIQGEEPENGKFFRSGATISTWFPNAKDFKNDIIVEEAFPIGEFGVLTMLYTDATSFTFTLK